MPGDEEKQGDQGVPCFHCDPQRHISMVQHLIEKCLVMRMSRDDTVHALASRAGIRPLVTLTVWKELLKENRSFFSEYFREIAFKPSTNLMQESLVSLGGDRRQALQQRKKLVNAMSTLK